MKLKTICSFCRLSEIFTPPNPTHGNVDIWQKGSFVFLIKLKIFVNYGFALFLIPPSILRFPPACWGHLVHDEGRGQSRREKTT